MAIETKRWKQDGVSLVAVREIVDGVGTGAWYSMGGTNSASVAREVTERELLGNNLVYAKTSKFKQFTGTLNHWGQAWEALKFFLPGSLTIDGNKATFAESTSGQPTKFEMVIFSDADEEGGGTAVIGEHFPNCQATNFNNAKTSGEYVSFEVTFTALADSNSVPRSFIVDEDLVAFNITNDTVAPTITSTTPAAAATGVVVSAPLTATFSKSMNDSSLAALKVIRVSTGVAVAAVVTYSDADPFVATVTPDASLTALTDYIFRIPASVKSASGVNLATESNRLFTTA